MTQLIIDAANEKIFFILINDNNIYIKEHENNKNHYEKLSILINQFLEEKNSSIKKIDTIYVNRGPGSFAGIRNALSWTKAIHLVNKTDYYCYSFKDFGEQNNVNYKEIPYLCNKHNTKKNLINPNYSG